MKIARLFLFLLLIPTLVGAQCLSWEPPAVNFEGIPLTGALDIYLVYVGATPDFATMTEQERLREPFNPTAEGRIESLLTCQAIGLTPHKWACVKAGYPEGFSVCATIERNPPGPPQKTKVSR